MTIVQNGSVNLGAIIVPDILVNIVPPELAYINGVPSNICGLVGAASWGPINKATVDSGYASYSKHFGALMARKYDMGTALAFAVLQGAQSFRCVRVTDDSDTAAFATMPLGAAPVPVLAFTARYTGIVGNSIQVTFGPGAAANSWRAVVSLPGVQQEVFDNLAGTGAALWAAVAAAINTGAGQRRGGPSEYVIASVLGTPTLAPKPGATVTVALTGGTDGDSGLTDARLVGVDGSPRTGMYALRTTGGAFGAAVATLCDVTDLSQFSTIAAFALQEGIYFLQSDAPGACMAGNVGNMQASSNGVAVDTYAMKVLAGDWVYWNDPVTLQQRVVSPVYGYLGLLANRSPEQSGLNDQIFGIAATQSTFNGGQYSNAELTVIAQARFDVVTFPSVGGNYYSARLGINLSSDASIHGDNYSRLTPYIARTFNAALGKTVGKLQTPSQRRNAKANADAFFQVMWDLGQIGNAENTTPFKVILDVSNNPPSRVALGYETAAAFVQYLSVIEKFIMNLEGGQSVQIVSSARQYAAVAA